MLKAIFFDMDGTITRPHIDWKELRVRVGVPVGVPIMAHIEELPAAERDRAEAILLDIEYEAAEKAESTPESRSCSTIWPSSRSIPPSSPTTTGAPCTTSSKNSASASASCSRARTPP